VDGLPVCRDVSELVTGYLERSLPLRTRLGVHGHLLRCDACRRYVGQMRQTIRLLASITLAPPNPEVESRVLGASRGLGPEAAPGD
jgi:predicted anti-sigma-YlaC factor YlaD